MLIIALKVYLIVAGMIFALAIDESRHDLLPQAILLALSFVAFTFMLLL